MLGARPHMHAHAPRGVNPHTCTLLCKPTKPFSHAQTHIQCLAETASINTCTSSDMHAVWVNAHHFIFSSAPTILFFLRIVRHPNTTHHALVSMAVPCPAAPTRPRAGWEPRCARTRTMCGCGCSGGTLGGAAWPTCTAWTPTPPPGARCARVQSCALV